VTENPQPPARVFSLWLENTKYAYDRTTVGIRDVRKCLGAAATVGDNACVTDRFSFMLIEQTMD